MLFFPSTSYQSSSQELSFPTPKNTPQICPFFFFYIYCHHLSVTSPHCFLTSSVFLYAFLQTIFYTIFQVTFLEYKNCIRSLHKILQWFLIVAIAKFKFFYLLCKVSHDLTPAYFPKLISCYVLPCSLTF